MNNEREVRSCAASDDLRKSVRAEKKLIQDVPTRWNSTYYMVQRFLELKNIVSEILIHHKTAPPLLTGMELNIASSLLNVLRPLEAATKEISGDKYGTSSKVIPLVHCMVSKLKALVIDEPVVLEVQKLTLKEINKRMGAIEHVSVLAISTLLDPRFKKIHFHDPLACAGAIQKIKDLMKISLDESHGESDSDKSDQLSEDFSLWSDHHKLVHKNWKSNRNEESVSDEISVYLRATVGRLNENPLEIWADFKQQFP
ncbi:PREDICTED: zinc finger BED domain-containing protein 4-like, partial [Rhagoletis zephyria]|uniref:zinc finger BED domain-containing protein 4-like n=1 Tax=Rhagoletis zephyria TaxID=28612 RepID=UPI0008112189